MTVLYTKDRMRRLVALMKESNISGAIISPGTNFLYLTGLSFSGTLERLFVLLISCEGESVLLAPKLYENELRATWIENFYIWSDSENPYEIFGELVKKLFGEHGRVAVDDTMQAVHLLRAYNTLKTYNLEPLGTIISKLRIIKDELEINFIREAARIADRTVEEILKKGLVEGKTEREIARFIETEISDMGADSSFDPIVASGPNGANPHHTPTDRKIREGDLIIVDFGAKFRGYCSDITRAFSIGKPSEKIINLYEIVKEAQEEAFQAVKEGIAAREVDSVARSIITNKGYGEKFTHRTGHGLGLDVHEEPYIAQNNNTELKNGMVFTIEPGIYLEGEFGIRIEDDVAVINGRGERLTKTSRDLIPL